MQRLGREGWRVTGVGTVKDAIEALAGRPDLVVLDRRLPDGEGLDVLRAVRATGDPIAVVVLSARGLPADRVEGLEDGADDTSPKPFHLRELLARVRNALERRAGDGVTEVAVGSAVLDVAARVLRRDAGTVALTRLEFELLHYFVQHPERAISRTELLDRVWGHDHYPTTRTVDFHVLGLRRKIEAPDGPPRHIQTVQGVGYRYVP